MSNHRIIDLIIYSNAMSYSSISAFSFSNLSCIIRKSYRICTAVVDERKEFTAMITLTFDAPQYTTDFGTISKESLKSWTNEVVGGGGGGKYLTHSSSYYPVPQTGMSFKDVRFMTPLPPRMNFLKGRNRLWKIGWRATVLCVREPRASWKCLPIAEFLCSATRWKRCRDVTLSMRPILSATGTYNYKLAKWLEGKLKPLSINEYTIIDAFDFAEEIRNLSVNEDDILVSYDVTAPPMCRWMRLSTSWSTKPSRMTGLIKPMGLTSKKISLF